MSTKRIYSLSIDSKIFYIGQTSGQLYERLNQHFKDNPSVKYLPEWIKAMIRIELIEITEPGRGNAREQHWISYYRDKGVYLINKNHYNKRKGSNITHNYKRLTIEEARFIADHLTYTEIANKIGVNPETIRIAVIKKRIKKIYYENIFCKDTILKFNALYYPNLVKAGLY